MEAETGVMRPQPRDAWSPQKLKETRKDPPLEPLGEPGPADTLMSAFRPPGLWENALLSPKLQQPQDTGSSLPGQRGNIAILGDQGVPDSAWEGESDMRVRRELGGGWQHPTGGKCHQI